MKEWIDARESTGTVSATATEEGMRGQTTEGAGASSLIALARKKRAQQRVVSGAAEDI